MASTPTSGYSRSSRLSRFSRSIVTAIALCGLTGLAHAHADLERQIQSVTEQIAVAPSALLYLKRGELHHEHDEYASALADYAQAEKLDPTVDAVRLARARTFFKSGQLKPAHDVLDRYLETKPNHADAFLIRARVLAGLKQYPAAIRDFDRTLTVATHALPEWYIERSQAVVAAGEPLAALTGLDDGIARLGNLVTLQNAAIGIELQLHRYDAALARVDRVLSTLQRRESWLVRRGEILETAARGAEARRAFAEALTLIEQLPAHHRDAQSMRDLQARLQTKLKT